jgi:hypothetical protein
MKLKAKAALVPKHRINLDMEGATPEQIEALVAAINDGHLIYALQIAIAAIDLHGLINDDEIQERMEIDAAHHLQDMYQKLTGYYFTCDDPVQFAGYENWE